MEMIMLSTQQEIGSFERLYVKNVVDLASLCICSLYHTQRVAQFTLHEVMQFKKALFV